MTAPRGPVFHDPSGRRLRWTVRLTVALGALFLALCALFLLSLVAVPVLPPTAGLSEPVRRALRPHLPKAPERESRLSGFLIQRERRHLLAQVAHDRRESARAMRDATRTPDGEPPVIAA